MNGGLLRNRDEKGFSLTELLTVMLILSTLMAIGFFSYTSMSDRYSIEKQMKQMHMDLTNARLRAMQRNRAHFVTFTSTQYTVYEDTSPWPDGDGLLSVATDSLVLQQSLAPRFPVALLPGSPNQWSAAAPLKFTPQGMVDTAVTSTGTVRVPVEMNGEYDCIVISEIKNTLGKWDGTSQCIAK